MTTTTITQTQPDLLTAKAVCARISFCLAYLYRMVNEGRFPKPVKIGKRAVRWRAADVDAWLAAQHEGGAS